jgi:CRISPR-associated endonuclease Csn1
MNMENNYILGLDLGETSLGVAILETENGKPIKVEAMGVRIFPDGRKDKEPLNVKRRDARGIRRNNQRTKQRKEKLKNFLKRINFEVKNFDENPYILRAKAIKEKLERYELAKVLMHLNQRRGFKSNRKDLKKAESNGNMKIALNKTKEMIAESGKETIGEWLCGKDQQRVKVRQNGSKNEYDFFPSRELYEEETKKIIEKQSEFYPELNTPVKYRKYDFSSKEHKNVEETPAEIIAYIIFEQRDLKEQEVGKCIFEEEEHRIAKAMPSFQKFRILQEVNNLKIKGADASLTLDEKQKIIDLLNKQKKVTFDSIRKELNIKKYFNLESERRKDLEGNITACEMRKYITNWDDLNLDTQNEYVNALLKLKTDEEIEEFFKDKEVNNFKDKEVNKSIVDIDLPDDYGNLSLKAINKILPFLEDGLIYNIACDGAGYKFANIEIEKKQNKLPYYGEILSKSCIQASQDNDKKYGKITNVTVHKGLNQIRQCVNDIIAKYGIPGSIHVEVARTLKMTKEQKKKLDKKQAEEQKINEAIIETLKESGIIIDKNDKSHSYYSIEKFKIWEKLNTDPKSRKCPYCGKPIGITDLISPEFEIEHILPFSRTYDNSIKNKVISCKACNNFKGERTPYEAFGNRENYEEILNRAKEIGKYFSKKNCEEYSPYLWRFEEHAMKKWSDDNKVMDRMLKDTQYFSVATREYLTSILPSEKIIVNPGRMTAMLRHHWGLNSIINEEDKKDRTDHRHHAIDACVVACINRSNIKEIATMSGKNYFMKEDLEKTKAKNEPFPNFRKNVENAVDNIIISYKPTHKKIEKGKSTGKLHNDTFYGKVKDKENTYVVRKNISYFVGEDFEKRVDKIVDEKIKEELKKLGENKIKEELKKKGCVELTWDNKKKNCSVKINTLRWVYEISNNMVKIADYEKYAKPDGNYCAYIYENGEKYGMEIPTIFEVHKKDYEPQFKKDGKKFVMQLFINDMVEVDASIQNSVKEEKKKNLDKYVKNGKVICRVKRMSGNTIHLRPHLVAKETADTLSYGVVASNFKKCNIKKISVNILGEIKYL